MSSEPSRFDDLDPQETKEWLESIDSVLKTHGPERAHFLLERLIDYTRVPARICRSVRTRRT